MDHDAVADKVHSLSNLELAALLCLVAEQHCIVEADPSQLDAVAQELQVVSVEFLAAHPHHAPHAYALDADNHQRLRPVERCARLLGQNHRRPFRQRPAGR